MDNMSTSYTYFSHAQRSTENFKTRFIQLHQISRRHEKYEMACLYHIPFLLLSLSVSVERREATHLETHERLQLYIIPDSRLI